MHAAALACCFGLLAIRTPQKQVRWARQLGPPRTGVSHTVVRSPKKNGRPSGVEGAPFQLKGVWGMRELIGATTVAGRFYSRHEAGRMRAADHWGHEEQCAVAPRTGPQVRSCSHFGQDAT